MDWLVRVIDVFRFIRAIRCLTMIWIDWIVWLDLIFSIGFRFDSIGDDWRALINWAEWIGFIGFIRLAWGELVLDGIICFIGVIGLYWTGSAWLVDFIPWLSLDWFDWLIGLLGLLWLFYEEEESNAKWKTQIESNGNHGAARAASRGVRKVALWKCGRAKKRALSPPRDTRPLRKDDTHKSRSGNYFSPMLTRCKPGSAREFLSGHAQVETWRRLAATRSKSENSSHFAATGTKLRRASICFCRRTMVMFDNLMLISHQIICLKIACVLMRRLDIFWTIFRKSFVFLWLLMSASQAVKSKHYKILMFQI